MIIRCPNCQTPLELSTPAPVVLCVACGHQIDLSTTEYQQDPLASFASAPTPAPSTFTRPRSAQPRRRNPLLPIVISCAVLLAVTVMLVVVATRKTRLFANPPVASAQTDDAYPRLAAMKSKAEELALHKQPAEAHAVYGKLLADPAATTSTDPRIHDLVAAARADQSRLYQLLITTPPPAKPEENPTPPPNSNSAPAPPTATAQTLPTTPPPSVPPDVNPYTQPKQFAGAPPTSRPNFPAQKPGPRTIATQLPALTPATTTASDDLDARIGHSMQKAVDFILSSFNGPELSTQFGRNDVRSAGLHALCVYALLQAGQSLDDDRLSIKGKIIPPMIDAMKAHNLDDQSSVAQVGAPRTYAHSLRAAALAVCDRPQDRKALQADVKWLVAAQTDGGFTYDDRNPKSITSLLNLHWDNSNSQYGLLGVWAGAEAGVEVPDRFWQAVDKHWKSTQRSDGQWPYDTDADRTWAGLAMTSGGIASLLVTYDYLDLPKIHGAVGRDPYPAQIGLGLHWLETGDNCLSTPNPHTFYLGYDLYSLERVGLASGLKFFGAHDWYRQLAQTAMTYQWPGGAFGDDKGGEKSLTETAYVVLFLARGRHPVMMEKLRFQKYWDNRPRDLANLTKYASRELERQLNWQVVSVDRPWQDWFDSPVLFIASHQAPILTDENYANLRGFVEAGGLILTQTDAASDAFTQWVPRLVKKIAPDYELQQLPTNHPLFTVNYKITAPPKLMGVSNGSRLLLVHSPVDLSAAWQRSQRLTQKSWFELGINVFAYASGKRVMRNRVAGPVVPEPTAEPSRRIRLARVSYPGNWNPEPYAWTRLSKLLHNDSGVALDIRPVPADAMSAERAPLAHLTGTAAWTPGDAQCAALAAYVKAGGVVLIDSTGGQPAFAHSVEVDLLPRAFPGVKLLAVPADHPVMAGVTLGLRSYAAGTYAKPPAVRIGQFGRGYILFTPLDLGSGLLGTATWGIAGYTPSASQQLARNLLGWAESVREGAGAERG